MEDLELIDNTIPETTGDFYLDAYLEDEAEIPQQMQEVEEEVEEIDDDEATFPLLEKYLRDSVDEDTFEQVRTRYGDDGVQELGKQKFKDVHSEIVSLESGGRYDALPGINPKTGERYSSAVGKYQFLWKTWGKDIAKHTGVNSKEEFRRNPEAQDHYYNNVYVPKYVMPWIAQTKRHLKTDVSDASLIKLFHYRGAQGAMDYLQGGIGNKPEDYNAPISKYTGIRPGGGHMKNGGWVYAQKGLGTTPLTSISMGYRPVSSMTTIPLAEKYAEQLAEEADKLSRTREDEKKDGFGYDDVRKITNVAQGAAAIGQNAMGIATSITDAKGKAMSNTLSGLSALAGSRMQKEQEQSELLQMYESIQENFNSSTTDTLGQTKNIWDQ